MSDVVSSPAGSNRDVVAKAAQAAKEAGTGPTDTIAISCELIRFGIFFDGTSNFRDNVELGGDFWHTNVDLLEQLYQDNEAPEQLLMGARVRPTRLMHRYMRGIGVNEDGSRDWQGAITGMGPEGVGSRVEQAINEILDLIRENAQDMQPCDIWFDAFGFSRGAAAARDFANGIFDEEIDYNSTPIRLQFMGLFDTVASLGLRARSGDTGDIMVSTDRDIAQTIVHITADDEIREKFPLSRAQGEQRIRMVGAHGDIGGGYPLGRDRTEYEYSKNEFPLVQRFAEQRWGITANNPSPQDDDFITNSGTNEGRQDTRKTEFIMNGFHGLQHVALHLMHRVAIGQGVPFPIEEPSTIGGLDVEMNDELQAYFQQVSAGMTNAEDDLKIRRVYAHWSVQNGSAGAYQPEVNATRREPLV